ncbi:hypothetical protein XENORESO_017897 [Xenotaenia resolanae]|uniref:Uncharacterized protein n=1 Tax=Xenotaenia resolanae TaxID=208358 RepID=A0ABV0WXC4_9TELE
MWIVGTRPFSSDLQMYTSRLALTHNHSTQTLISTHMPTLSVWFSCLPAANLFSPLGAASWKTLEIVTGAARYSINRGALRGWIASTSLPECFALSGSDHGPEPSNPESSTSSVELFP